MAAGEKPEWTVARRAGPDTEGRPSATAAKPICAGSWRSKGPRPATGGRPSRHSAAAAQTRPAPAPTAPAHSTAPPIPWPCGQRSPCGIATSRWRSDSGGRSGHGAEPTRLRHVHRTTISRDGTKSRVLDYRAQGRRRRIALARTSEISLNEARKRAGAELARIRAGESDPATRRQESREAPIVNDGLDRFFAEHVRERASAQR